MTALIQNPAVMKKVQQEIRSSRVKKDFLDKLHLPYCQSLNVNAIYLFVLTIIIIFIVSLLDSHINLYVYCVILFVILFY